MSVSTLNRAKYAGYDFRTITDDLLARLQVEFASDFNDFSLSTMAIVMLDIVAFGLDTLSFYLDRRANEAYLTTARTRSAVSKLTRGIGYKMVGAVPAVADVQVNLNKLYSFQVTIPKQFQFQGPNGLIFEAAQATNIPANTPVTTAFTIPCYQGVTLTENLVASSVQAKNQVFQAVQTSARQLSRRRIG
jgi:hypothetical protein